MLKNILKLNLAVLLLTVSMVRTGENALVQDAAATAKEKEMIKALEEYNKAINLTPPTIPSKEAAQEIGIYQSSELSDDDLNIPAEATQKQLLAYWEGLEKSLKEAADKDNNTKPAATKATVGTTTTVDTAPETTFAFQLEGLAKGLKEAAVEVNKTKTLNKIKTALSDNRVVKALATHKGKTVAALVATTAIVGYVAYKNMPTEEQAAQENDDLEIAPQFLARNN